MTRAVILAAGQGTRLKPLTHDKPKTLVNLLGKSLLLRQVSVLQTANIKNIHVVTGYHAEKIKKLGFNCSYNENYSSSNMVTSLFCASAFLQESGDLIISYGDIIFQLDNLQKLLASEAEISVMIDRNWKNYWELRFKDPLSDAESLILNPDQTIKQLGKKVRDYSHIQGQYTGLLKIRGDMLGHLLDFYAQLDRYQVYDHLDFDNMYMTTFLQLLIDAQWNVEAVVVDNGWLEVDSVNDLKLYERLAKTNQLTSLCQLD